MSFPNPSQEGTMIVIVKEYKIALVLSDCHAHLLVEDGLGFTCLESTKTTVIEKEHVCGQILTKVASQNTWPQHCR